MTSNDQFGPSEEDDKKPVEYSVDQNQHLRAVEPLSLEQMYKQSSQTSYEDGDFIDAAPEVEKEYESMPDALYVGKQEDLWTEDQEPLYES